MQQCLDVVFVVTVATCAVLNESGEKSLVTGTLMTAPEVRVCVCSPAPPVGFLQKPPLFKFAYFHLISHQYETGSHERARFTLFFEQNPLIDTSPVSHRVSSRSPQPYAGLLGLREDEPLRVNVCVHPTESVASHMTKLRSSHGAERQRLFVCVKGWRKRGFPLWIEL